MTEDPITAAIEHTPLQDAINDIGKDGDGLSFGVTKADGQASAGVTGSKSLGKGWSIGGGWQWVKDKGSALFFGGTWKPGAK